MTFIKTSWTDEEVRIVREMAARGQSYTLIANALNRTVFSVKAICGRLHISIDKGQKPWTQDELDTLRTFANAGYQIKQIAHHMGRSEHSIGSALSRYLGGIKANATPKSVKRRVTVEQLLAYPPMRVGEIEPQVLDIHYRAFAVAMKRAGHTYATGEFRITSEGRAVPHCQLVSA